MMFALVSCLPCFFNMAVQASRHANHADLIDGVPLPSSKDVLPPSISLETSLALRLHGCMLGKRPAWWGTFVLAAVSYMAMNYLRSKSPDSGGPPGTQWWYRDPQGRVQGPFSTFEMQQWHEMGYLKPSLPIKCVEFGPFAPLSQLFPRPAMAFHTAPEHVQWPAWPPDMKDAAPARKVVLPDANGQNLQEAQIAEQQEVLRMQHETLAARTRDLEVEMGAELEAELEVGFESGDSWSVSVANAKLKSKQKKVSGDQHCNEEQAAINEWRARRQAQRLQMEKSQMREFFGQQQIVADEKEEIKEWRARRQMKRGEMEREQIKEYFSSPQ